jgi:hypothetical protein
LPQLAVYLHVLSDVGEGTEDTSTHELSTLDAVLLYYIVGIPYGGSEVILMTARNEEVLCIIDLGVLVISKANVSSLLSVFLLLLLGEVDSLHLLNDFVGLLSTFCNIEGAGDNIIEGMSLPMADTLITCHVIGNDKTIGANETEDTCHDTEGGSTIVGVDDNNLRTLIGGGESIEEVPVRETHNVLGERSNLIGLALSEGIGYFIALSTESVNDIGSGELTILLRASGGVVGLKHLRATSSDFGISECEHSLDCLSIFWSFLFRGGRLSSSSL